MSFTKGWPFAIFLEILSREFDLDAFNPNIKLDEKRFKREFSDSNGYVFFTVILQSLTPLKESDFPNKFTVAANTVKLK